MKTKELLKLGAAYSKKSLAELFEDEGLKTLREGIHSVKRYNSIFLFVDLIKKGKEERFQFDDRFVGDHFHWDSQTTQYINTPRIQSIVQKKVEVHLFCRIDEKLKGITQPFYYCGELEYLDYDERTSKPVHIEYLSLDFDPTTSDDNLRALYNWMPDTIIASNSNSADRKIKPVKKTYKPSYTERKGLVTSRVGQGYYRQQILEKWEHKCAITGCDIESVLIASHIKGWSESNENERLDPDNGILLSPNVDALFDRHLITFNDHGELLVSKKINQLQMEKLAISRSLKLPVNDQMQIYLKHHRSKFLLLQDV